jgi:hypothetical protein
MKQNASGKSSDFLKPDDRRKAREQIEKERPSFVFDSPPCTSFCCYNERLNHRHMDPKEVQRRCIEGHVLLNVAIEVYELQMQHGRHVIHEHPDSASGSEVPRITR